MSTAQELPEVWLRGRVDGFESLMMPIAHALLQVREDLVRLGDRVPTDHVWMRPGGAPSIGYHIRHTGGALDRLFTYARGQSLSAEQLQSMRAEGEPGAPLADLVAAAVRIVDAALDQVRSTPIDALLLERKVGRAGLPSNVIGLLFHGAEHSTRHVGQAITTAKILNSGA